MDSTATDGLEKEELSQYVKELSSKIEARELLRRQNTNIQWPSDEVFQKLDSSLKRNTAFVKKLRQFTSNSLDGLLKDIEGLNLTKYLTEVSLSIAEAKLKLSDIPAALVLCSKLHSTYSDFSKYFLENWQKNLSVKQNEKISNPSKLRVDLRFFGELLSSGIFPLKQGLTILGSALIGIINQDKSDHSNMSIILSFCKHCGEEYAGLQSSQMQKIAKKYNVHLPRSSFLPSEKQQNLRSLLKDYYVTLVKHLKVEHKELKIAERNKKRQMEAKGEFANDKREQLEILQANYEKLLTGAQTFSDLLDEKLPELYTEPEPTEESDGVVSVICGSDTPLDPWGDEETKLFYTQFPNLVDFLPNYHPAGKKEKDEEEEEAGEKITEEALDADVEPELNITEIISAVEENVEPAEVVASVPATTSQNKQSNFSLLLQNLTNCVNKATADNTAIEFLLNFNNKPNRKKLVQMLFGVQRTRLDLLPMYSRIMAVVSMVSPDAGADLCQLLKNDFKYQVAKRDQINIESKIKVVRFIGELVKFGLYDKLEALMCLKILLYNFQHHQIEMTCAFLEVCGFYLYNCTESRIRIHAYLEKMMRFKTVLSLDPRHAAQVENCYYLIKPPEYVNQVVNEKPPMHQYIRQLLFEELNKHNVETILRLLRRLNYDDPVIMKELIKCLSKAYKIRYNLIKHLADVLSGLLPYQPEVAHAVIDNVFDDVRAGLEIHSTKFAQRRIAQLCYLGELYNYRLIGANDILNTLYLIISLGVATDNAEAVSIVDPPTSLFRLKMVCVLLNTCGMYFTKSCHKKKLDYFLVFFQQYYWFKKSHPIFTPNDGEYDRDLFPILIENEYRQCLASLRPKLALYKSLDEAKLAVEKLKNLIYPDLNKESFGETENVDQKGGNESSGDDSEDESSDEPTYDASENENVENEEDEEDEECFSRREKNDLDIEFEQMFEKIAQESIQERLRESKSITRDIQIPTVSNTSARKTYAKSYNELQLESENMSREDEGVEFTLLLRGGKSSSKGGKQQLKSFRAPADCQLSQDLLQKREMLRREDERVKRLTLNITERIEEEDYLEQMSSQNFKSASSHRPAKNSKFQKFKHQKGVPDADAIFN